MDGRVGEGLSSGVQQASVVRAERGDHGVEREESMERETDDRAGAYFDVRPTTLLYNLIKSILIG